MGGSCHGLPICVSLCVSLPLSQCQRSPHGFFFPIESQLDTVQDEEESVDPIHLLAGVGIGTVDKDAGFLPVLK